jgi:hypothetical protein
MFLSQSVAVTSVLVLVVVLCGRVQAAESGLPVPPQQKVKWTPPETTLPAELVSGTALLFEYGLADPRGCEYRNVTIRTGRHASGIHVKTQGWLLPSSEKRRFAVCWNGAVYPVQEVGERADVKATIAAAIDQAERKYTRDQDAAPGDSEADRVYGLTNQRLKACLLLRLGEVKLAEDFYKRARKHDHASEAVLIAEAGACLYQQAENAHLRGDDDLALPAIKRYAEFLTAAGKGDSSGAEPDEKLPIPAKVSRLIADQERRAKVRRTARPSVEQRQISKLIADLENLTGYHGQMWDRITDPRQQAILDRRDEAIGPLLDCLENDERLTRSINVVRSYSSTTEVELVAHAALELLVQMLDPYVRYQDELSRCHREWTEDGDEESRQVLVRMLHACARESKGLTVPQTWRQVLADDRATPQQWVEAAKRLMKRSDNTGLQRSDPLPGEVLRRETAPSVTSLLQRRAKQVAALANDPDQGKQATQLLEGADNIMQCLIKWDPAAARPLLKDHWANLMSYQRHMRRYGDSTDVSSRIGAFTLERIELGDDDGMADYLAWLEIQDPKKLGYLKPALAPLAWYPDHAGGAKVAEKIFLATESPWNPVFSHAGRIARDFDRILPAGLLGVPAFRKQLIEQLANEEVVGELTVVNPGEAKGKTLYNYSTFSHVHTMPDDPRAEPVSTTIKVRVCDAHAFILARAPGTPHFQLLWTLEHRNAAIKKLREVIERYGDRYRSRPHLLYSDMEREEWPWFESLRAPATDDDVAAGRAIFSLRSLGRVRPVPLDSPGQRATWFTSRQEPYRQTIGAKHVLAYSNRGRIWQAEEVEVEGRWQRYYGFVGDHGFFQVPADEIELNDAIGGPTLCDGVGYEMVFRGHDENKALTFVAGSPKPLVVQLRLRNYRAVAQTVPRTWLKNVANERTPRLRQGVELRLLRSFRDPGDAIGDFGGQPFYEELTSHVKKFAADAGEVTQAIPPQGSIVVAEFNLRDCFRIDEPGAYSLHFSLPGRKTWRDEEYSTSAWFVVREETPAKD